MRGHLGLKETGGPDAVPADFTAAVAEVLRKSSVLRISEDGKSQFFLLSTDGHNK